MASFYEKDLPSLKVAAIHLVESKLATINEAAKIVGLHRNTISKAIKLKRKFGIGRAIQDNRGPKKPYHYTPERKAYIINLLKKFPDLIDEEIAKQAARGLKTRVSRQAVARIRVKLKGNNHKTIKRRKAKIQTSVKERHIDPEDDFKIAQKVRKKVRKKIFF